MASYPPPPPPPPPPGYDPQAQRRYQRDQFRAQMRAQRDAVRAQQQQIRYQMRGMRRGSVLGPLLLIAVGVLDEPFLRNLPGFKKRLDWFLENRQDLARYITSTDCGAVGAGATHRRLLAIPELAEDVALCRNLARAGHRILVDKTVRVGHQKAVIL